MFTERWRPGYNVNFVEEQKKFLFLFVFVWRYISVFAIERSRKKQNCNSTGSVIILFYKQKKIYILKI